VGPDSAEAFDRYWRSEKLPFIGLPDPDHKVAQRYKQQVNLFKLGRMPLVTVIDGGGLLRFAHYGASMSDIPENSILLEAIDQIRAASRQDAPR
jgi:hypothetical protein